MTRSFQSNPFLEFAAEMEARDAPAVARRARIRAQNHISPRCSICPGRFVGDIADVIEFARVGDIDMPGFDPDDLICGMCWYELSDELWGTA
jgi:hypothetical protein